MIKKIFLIKFIILILASCGYSPMLSQNSDLNFMIVDYELKGDSQINKLIENRLDKYSSTNSDKKFKIKIDTNYNKITAVRDLTGKITNLKLITKLDLIYTIDNSGQKRESKKVSFSESVTIVKNENNYEQDKYETIVVKNMSELLLNKLILFLSRAQ
tara:strand:+ start:348 stop:821 length:474 start_codon:yes stop_codon:yes gene_type:complete